MSVKQFFCIYLKNRIVLEWVTASQFAESGSLTGSDGSNQGQQGDGPRVVPRSDDQHHAEGLRLDVNLVWYGEEVLLHRPRSRPLGQLLYCQLDLVLDADELQEGGVILALLQKMWLWWLRAREHHLFSWICFFFMAREIPDIKNNSYFKNNPNCSILSQSYTCMQQIIFI